MTNVLVAGGSGFIGSHLTERLVSKGCRVAALVRKSSDSRFLKSLGVELRVGDLLEPDSLRNAFLGIDTVFCLVNVKPAAKTQQEYLEELNLLHTVGTKNIIEACKVNNITRLIYLSSVAAIGYRRDVSVYNELSEETPIDPYGKAKFDAERILRKSALDEGIDVTILQPPGVFGERGLGALGKIIFFTEKGIVPIMGSGKNKQSLTYVGNVVNQAIFAAENRDSTGKTYIVSDDMPYTVNELVEVVSQAMKLRPLKIHIPVWIVVLGVSIVNFFGKIFFREELANKENIIAIATERIFDGSRIFRELNYKQEYGLAEGISRTIKWYYNKNA